MRRHTRDIARLAGPGAAWRPALACLALLLAALPAIPAESTLTAGGLVVTFDSLPRTLRVCDAEGNVLLDDVVVRARVGGREVASNGRGVRTEAAVDAARGELALSVAGAFTLKAEAREGQVFLRVEGKLQGPAEVQATSGLGPGALPAFLKDESASDKGVLVTTLGPAEVPGARSLFDPERDLAVTLAPAGGAQWLRGADGGWELRASARAGEPLLALRARPHYYRDELGIAHYAPLRKPARWPTAPVVAMTWYGIEAMKGRPAQTKERLFPEIDWVAKNLRPYAGDDLVFQLDDNYLVDDEKGMREISDHIRARGLVPGIWFTPFTVAPKSLAEAHPEWFLRGANGKLVGTFGGINWGGNLTLNVTNPEAVANWFGMGWHRANEAWNFDFFKIDGQPQVIRAYAGATNGGGIEGYRRGLEIGRGIVGPEKFINACWGAPSKGGDVPQEAIGWVNGSRTGPDTGYFPDATDVVVQWNFLNNVAWYSDPDAAACMYRSTVERARQNAQARLLTGQQFLTDEQWTRVPPAIARVWQLSFPMLDIKPACLYRIADARRYDVFDLKIAKPWGRWDVVGAFNYEGKRVQKSLDLARLPLAAAEVHVYDFWNGAYLGRHPRTGKLALEHEPYEGRLFAVVPAMGDRPALISTSRHGSQGGLDLEQVEWSQEGARWRVHGRSSHLVPGDRYELVFAPGARYAAAASCSAGEATSARGGGVARVSFMPSEATAEWDVTFEPIRDGFVEAAPAVLDVPAGAAASLDLTSLGTKQARLKVTASSPAIRVTGVPVALGPRPSSAKASVRVDTSGVAPGEALEGTVTVAVVGSPVPAQVVAVRSRAPLPENLARRAKAQASSIWDNGYVAAMVNDGSTETRWNSRKDEPNGCWVELAWDAPVRFDRVTIDECTDFGERVQAWKLLAGDGELKEIAAGTTLGRRHEIRLAAPVEAKRLRLLIEKATETPTIWEMEVRSFKAR